MKIRLTTTIPVAIAHGLYEGRVMKVEEKEDGMWVKGDAGKHVRILGHEYEVVVPDED